MLDKSKYITKEEIELVSKSIDSQLTKIKDELKDKNNFKIKETWKKTSIIKEGESNGDEHL